MSAMEIETVSHDVCRDSQEAHHLEQEQSPYALPEELQVDYKQLERVFDANCEPNVQVQVKLGTHSPTLERQTKDGTELRTILFEPVTTNAGTSSRSAVCFSKTPDGNISVYEFDFITTHDGRSGPTEPKPVPRISQECFLTNVKNGMEVTRRPLRHLFAVS